MMTKHILILNWWDSKNPNAGGAEVYLEEVFSRLAKRGYEITLLCSRFAGGLAYEKIKGLQVIRKGPWWLINLSSIFWYLKNKNKFDLVIDFTNKIPYLTPLWVRSRPHLAIAHHLFGRSLIIEYGSIGQILAFIERQFYKVYRKSNWIAPSKSTGDELITIGVRLENITIIDEGRPENRISVITSKQPLLVYVGRLKKYKRLDVLLEVLPVVLQKIPRLKTIIIGDGPDKKRLLRIRQRLGLENQVKFLGYVSEKEKLKWLGKAWINVQPSIKEGWGLSVIEAAACGTPTIVANVPGLRESVVDGKTGWLFETPKELGNLLIEILKNHRRRTKAGQEALKFAQQFSWDKTANGVEKVIDVILRY